MSEAPSAWFVDLTQSDDEGNCAKVWLCFSVLAYTGWAKKTGPV